MELKLQLRVAIADGSVHDGTRCVRTPIRINNYVVRMELNVLPMDLGVYVILWTPWLETLDKGRPKMDFLDMNIRFTHRGATVHLRSQTGNGLDHTG